MELPFYLMSEGSARSTWDGLISLRGGVLHFELRRAPTDEATEFDLPLTAITQAEFQRGLVNRRLLLLVEGGDHRSQFPVGVSGKEVHLMVAKEDPISCSQPHTTPHW